MHDIGQKYALVGQFVYEFERVVAWVRHSCEFLLLDLDLRNNSVPAVIFGHRVWSAEPLVAVYEGMVNEVLKDQPGDDVKDLLTKLTKFTSRFRSVIEFRNKLLHGEHRYLDGYDEMLVLKLAPNKKGHKSEEILRDPKDLIDQIKLLQQLFGEIRHLLGNSCRLARRKYHGEE